MATDLERLVVSLDADIKKFESQMRRANAVTNTQMKAVETRVKTMSKSTSLSFADISKGFGTALGVTAATAGFKELADAATRTQNALKVAGLSGDQLTAVYEKLFKAAQDNAVPIESLVTLFSRASNVQQELGVSTDQLIGFTNNVAKALRVAGTDAQTASGALLQLAQALGSGKVRAEEFNSIQEAALPILQAVAAGIASTGGSVSKLRQLVIDGKLTSQQFFKAFEDGSKILDSKLKGSVTTIDQALVRLQNSLQDAAGKINAATGASDSAIAVIDRLAKQIEGLSNVFTAISGSPMGGYVERLSQINDWVSRILPGIGDIKRLSETDFNGVADFIRGDDVDKLQRAAEEIAHALENSVPRRLVTPEQFKQIEDLAKGLREGSVSAEDVESTLSGLGPKFTTLAGQLQPLIDKMREFAEAANMLKPIEVTASAVDARPAAGVRDTSILSDTLKRDQFFEQRNADAMKSELERNVDTRAKAIIDAAAKLGVTLTEAVAKIQARTEIASETAAKSLDGAVSGFVDRVVSAESNGVNTAKNPNSSATGPGQFIESTWLNLFRKYFPAEAANMGRDAILAVRTDSEKSRALIEAYARENAATLKAAGVSVDEAALQLAHFLGPQGAINVLKAPSGTLASSVLDAGAVNANKSILGNGATVDDVIAYAQKRAGMTTSGTQAIDNRENFEKSLQEQQRMLQALKEETGIRASLNPLVDDYGRKLTEVEKAQELLKMAQEEGTAAGKELTNVQQLLSGDLTSLSPAAQQQAEAMRALANGYGAATAEANKLKAAQEQMTQTAQAASQIAKDVVGGALTDIREAMADGKITAKEWKEVVVNALNRVADKLQEMLLNQLFPSNGGGLLGALFGGSTSFNPVGKVGLFDKGGFTGHGGKYDPAGIVHKGEYVFDQDSVKRIGLDRLRALHGYANGGLVRSAPRLPDLRGMGRSAQQVLSGDITVGFRKDGLNLEPEVVAVATRVGKAGMDHYRRNQFHDDVNRHNRYPRRKGGL